ncbi:hypothetical protein [Phaeodactylibacter xiamenensis]|uniref:hypothetical protein n=1 Tax=Phaeodactylibacter xiamenensis TaxID=1524460 RepID=UPI003BACE19E
MKKITIILIIFFTTSCIDVNKLVEEIAQDKMMESEHIGFIGEKSEQYQKFLKLKSKASDEKLKGLTTHENPLIRTYAYKSLIERELIKPSKAFNDALQDNESFSKMSGDQILVSDICTEIYFEAVNFYPDSETDIKKWIV